MDYLFSIPGQKTCETKSENTVNHKRLMRTKTKSNPTPVQLPRGRKFSYSLIGSLSALAAGLVLLGGPSNAIAQADNFNDGDPNTHYVTWSFYDAVSELTGGASGPQAFWDALPGGDVYHLTATPYPAAGGAGIARVSSFPPDVYTDFYVSVDVTNNVTTYSQVFGLLARAGDFSTPGVPTTRGYGFTYINGSVSAGGDNFLAIFRLKNDAQTAGVPGTGSDGSLTHCELHGVNLDQTKWHRFVFIGKGTHLEGRVYELPNVTTPIAVLDADTGLAPGDPQHTDGQCGVFAFNAADEAGAPYSGPVDVTFDNYYASQRCPMNISDMVVKDNFNDGNDTAPTVAWSRYDPISTYGGGALGPQNTWSFPNGNSYRLQAPVQPFDPLLGPGRVASTALGEQTDFRIAVDIVDWDDTIDQNAIGLMARLADVGLGTTTGYLFTYDVGGNGDMDVSKVTGEAATGLTLDAHDNMKMIPGNSYRFVFSGKGSELRALVFELPDMMNPIIDCVATDSDYASGVSGIIAAANSDADTADATFDNWSDTPLASPAVSVAVGATPGGSITVSWPSNLESIWVLESSATLGDGAVWTEVPLVDIVNTAAQNTYTGATPMAESANTYYRLKQL